MQNRDWPLLAALALCLAVGVACATYLLNHGEAPVVALAVAVVVLVGAQLCAIIFAIQKSNHADHLHHWAERKLAGIAAEQEEARAQAEKVFAELAGIRAHETTRATAMTQSLSDLKTSYQALAQSLKPAAAPPSFITPPQATVLMTPTPPPPAPPSQRVEFSLEPIVDLSSGRTAHYRLSMSFVDADGTVLSHDTFLHHADRTGTRQGIDLHAANEALVLLGRLRQRDQGLVIFMGLGASTLASEAGIAGLTRALQNRADLASGVVFEIPHAMLAGLAPQALEGLASLARQGAVFALSNVSVAGLDLQALHTLNVRYVSLEASAIDPVFGPSEAMTRFAQMARATKVTVIVSGVVLPELVAKLPALSRYGSGPVFASPRRVKNDLSDQPSPLNLAA